MGMKKKDQPVAEKIVQLKKENPNLTTREIGKLVERSHSRVVQILKQYNIEKQKVEDFKEHQEEILLGVQGRILESIDDEALQKASLSQKMVGYGIAFDKMRLLENKSTQNLTLAQIVVKVDREIMEKIEKSKNSPD